MAQQYNMHPNTFTNGLMPQHQNLMESQQLNQQGLQPQGLQNSSDQARLWMQQQQQAQQQMRSQQFLGGAQAMNGLNGMQGPSVAHNQQMMVNLMRNQSMPRMPNAQQSHAMGQKPMSVPFSPQNNPPGSFRDGQPGQNMFNGQNFLAAKDLPTNMASIAARDPVAVQQFIARQQQQQHQQQQQQQQQQQRQLQLMNAAQNQQSQNNPSIAFIRQMQQRQLARQQILPPQQSSPVQQNVGMQVGQLPSQIQQQQHPPNMIQPGAGMGQHNLMQNGMQPQHVALSQPINQSTQQLPPGQQLQAQHIQALRAKLVESYNQRRQATIAEIAELRNKMQAEAGGDVTQQQNKEQITQALTVRIRQMQALEAEVNKVSHMKDADILIWSNAQRKSRQGGPQQHVSQFGPDGGQQPGPSPQPVQPSMPTIPNSVPQSQSNTMQVPPQLVGNQMGQPSRASTTPFQLPAGVQNAPQASPNMQSLQSPVQLPAGVRPQTRPYSLPLMGPEIFNKAFPTFCQRNGIVLDQGILQFEGRPIDMHSLHVEVMNVGGMNRATQNDLWSVVGAKLGFVQFPGNETDAARSGPGVAQHLQNIYKRYLAHFDQLFINSIARMKKTANNQGPAGQPGAQNTGQPGVTGAQMPQPNVGGPGAAPLVNHELGNASQVSGVNHTIGSNPMGMSAQAMPTGLDGKQMNELMTYARFPAEELRRRGVREELVTLVEQNRNMLLAGLQAQQGFRDSLAKNVQVNPGQRSTPNMSHAFPNTPRLNPPANGMANNPRQHFSPPQMHVAPNGQPANNATSQPVQHTMSTVQKPFIPLEGGRRPTDEEIQRAKIWLEAVHNEFKSRGGGQQAMPTITIPDDQKQEYDTVFRELSGYLEVVSRKLPLMVCGCRENVAKNMTMALLTALQQKSHLDSGYANYMIDMKNLRGIRDSMRNWANSTPYHQYPKSDSGQTSSYHSSPGSGPSGAQYFSANGVPSTPQPRPAPPAPLPQPSPGSHVHAQSTPQILPPQLPPKRSHQIPVPSPGHVGPSTSTPPASAVTPVANPPTPVHTASSPQTPKSPRGPPTKKARQPPKRSKPASKLPVSAPTPTAGEASASGPAAVSTSNVGHAALPPPSPAEQKPSTPAPAAVAGLKRERDDDAHSVGLQAGPSPPKKVKTEWDGELSEELVKKQESIDSIKSEEDATKFFERMTEMLKMYDGQDMLMSAEISDELEKILKGYPGLTEVPEGSGSVLGGETSELGLSAQIKDESEAFFDWALFLNDDDTSSKPTTPELVQATSTNPSPGSGSDTESCGHGASTVVDTARIAGEDPENDPLRLSIWGAIDGGEAAYWEGQDGWKWGEPMQSDSAWAISTT